LRLKSDFDVTLSTMVTVWTSQTPEHGFSSVVACSISSSLSEHMTLEARLMRYAARWRPAPYSNTLERKTRIVTDAWYELHRMAGQQPICRANFHTLQHSMRSMSGF
jgi:hypothetical protein